MTTTTVPIKSWFWQPELADETGIPVRTLQHWRLTGSGGPPSYLIGRRVAYDRRDVEKWLAAQRAATGVTATRAGK